MIECDACNTWIECQACGAMENRLGPEYCEVCRRMTPIKGFITTGGVVEDYAGRDVRWMAGPPPVTCDDCPRWVVVRNRT
jgi:hypothetical protein